MKKQWGAVHIGRRRGFFLAPPSVRKTHKPPWGGLLCYRDCSRHNV